MKKIILTEEYWVVTDQSVTLNVTVSGYELVRDLLVIKIIIKFLNMRGYSYEIAGKVCDELIGDDDHFAW